MAEQEQVSIGDAIARSRNTFSCEPYRFWWGATSDAVAVDAESMALVDILARWVPSSMPQPWSWDDEERAIFARICLCCGEVGHYQRQLEAHLATNGLTQAVCLGEDGYVRDGHHRIVASRRLGIEVLPLESDEECKARWLRDHGPVAWEHRTVGDVPANLYRPRAQSPTRWRDRWLGGANCIHGMRLYRDCAQCRSEQRKRDQSAIKVRGKVTRWKTS